MKIQTAVYKFVYLRIYFDECICSTVNFTFSSFYFPYAVDGVRGWDFLATYIYANKCPMRSISGGVWHSAYRYLRRRFHDAQHHENIRGIVQKLWL